MTRWIGCLLTLQCWSGMQAQTVEDLSGAARRRLVRAAKQVTGDASKLAFEQFRALNPSAASSPAPDDLVQALMPPEPVSARISRFSAMTMERNFPELAASANANFGTLPILTVDPDTIAKYTSKWSPKRILWAPERMLCLIFAGTEATAAAILFKANGIWKTEAFASEKLAKPIAENLRWDLPRQPDHEQYFLIHVPSVKRYYLARYENRTSVCVFGGAHNDLTIATADMERLRDSLPKVMQFLGKFRALQEK